VRVLLDEQLPRQLAPVLIGHEVRTVQQESWKGLKNGALLDAAESAGFTVLLCAASNTLEDLLPLVPSALKAIQEVRRGHVIRVEA
jgi:hypothetical protein